MSDLTQDDGGCWYCRTYDDGKCAYSSEFDAWVHIECLKRRMAEAPECPEARIIYKEFHSLGHVEQWPALDPFRNVRHLTLGLFRHT